MTFTEIQARVSKTATFTGSDVDVSSFVDSTVVRDWTLKLQVEALTAAKSARFQFEETVDDWTTTLVGPTFQLKGLIEESYDRVKSWKKANFPASKIGIASGEIRLKLAELDSSGTVIYHAWMET